jgi:hypothetical protein
MCIEHAGYVLALHTWFTDISKPAGNRYYNAYPARAFGGTQAMCYPEPIRASFAEYLKSEGVEAFRTAYDYMLREYLMLTGIQCFATAPCLFQHIGTISTGLSLKFGSTGYFKKTSPNHMQSRRRGQFGFLVFHKSLADMPLPNLTVLTMSHFKPHEVNRKNRKL